MNFHEDANSAMGKLALIIVALLALLAVAGGFLEMDDIEHLLH